ncbi:protein TORNADO 2-like [Arachis stenosperma]|uniref:protein TORNADO 2-like n=1 Tax=Arachis stenosperma TaxID=217475 RepID=UPI0025AB7B67|nr:protein TORNADO 2-like [Arachis stenosperma]
MALSNNVIGGINLGAVLLSIPIIGAGIWLSTEVAESCVKVLEWAVLMLGIVMMVVGLAGLAGALLWRVQQVRVMIFYLVAMLVLIVLLLCLVVLVYTVTLRGHGNVQPNRSYLEYHLDDFSLWLRRRVRISRIKTCLSKTNVCARLNQSYRMPQDFFNAHLTPMQSGCCKPPTECGYTFVNPTYWISPISTAADADCTRWSNDQMQLCYNCDSCKAGVLAALRKEWRAANLILLITLLPLVALYLAAFFAFRNAKTDQLFRRYRQGYT